MKNNYTGVSVGISLETIISSILGGVAGGVVGLLSGFYLQSRQFNIEAQKAHLEDLKKHVIEPLIEAFNITGLTGNLEGWKIIDEIPVPKILDYPLTLRIETTRKLRELRNLFDEELYIDLLTNHYTELKDLIRKYYDKLKLKKDREEEFEIREYEHELWRKRKEIERALRILYLKTNLKTRREGLLRRPTCPFVKADLKLEKKNDP